MAEKGGREVFQASRRIGAAVAKRGKGEGTWKGRKVKLSKTMPRAQGEGQKLLGKSRGRDADDKEGESMCLHGDREGDVSGASGGTNKRTGAEG